MALKKKSASKISPRRVSLKKKQKGVSGGSLLSVIAVLSLATAAGVAIIGGAAPKVARPIDNPPQLPVYTCCDSGDGAACHPSTTNTLTMSNGQQYGLLKTGIVQDRDDQLTHLLQSGEKTPDGHMIYINNSDTFDAQQAHGSILPGSNCSAGKDYIGIGDPAKYGAGEPYWGGYFCVPNDELIYVCKDTIAECNKVDNAGKVPFDVYYRLSDGPVPAAISTMCPKPIIKDTRTGQKIIGLPTNGAHKNLQLETFQVVEDLQPSEYLSAWCKPAINLYPTQKTDVHVEVAPQGKMLVTIPKYPSGGWDVTAYPDGKIVSGSKTFPYLYWEASIPDALIQQPTEGYVVATKDLGNLFKTMLPQMGLNAKEQKEFSDYWLKALPQSPYYFVGPVTENQIDTLAPLTVNPKPDSVLRVSLYFKALQTNESVTPPTLTGFNRSGFTVTEWGGFLKRDKNHPNFTCAM